MTKLFPRTMRPGPPLSAQPPTPRREPARCPASEAFPSRGTPGLWTVVLLLITCILLSACRTSPKIDWSSRIGTYTYDQAVAELGPPDKTAKLSDGRTVADWVTGTRPRSGFSIGTGVYGRRSGVSVGQSIGGGTRARVLRLTFDPQNLLIHWART